MYNSIHKTTTLLGLIGHPVKQSFSPFIHNVSFEISKLDYIYLPFDVPTVNLRNALKGMVALGIKGFNVTVPHKVKILDYLTNLSDEATVTGSVNTIVNENGKLTGYNTDVDGIIESLMPFKNKITGKRVTVIGTGGAARALIYVLIRFYKPEKIHIVNRTEHRGELLKVFFKAKMKYDSFKIHELFPPDLVDVFQKSKLIVNATPIGMYPEINDNITSIPESFNKDQIVFDFVYNPVKTKFLELAESQGAITLNGINMLVHQAAKSFLLWTGKEMPLDQLYKSLLLYIQK
ncbi:MAG: shikimate dehydrogenase [Ignavibacteriaceae bacterium]